MLWWLVSLYLVSYICVSCLCLFASCNLYLRTLRILCPVPVYLVCLTSLHLCILWENVSCVCLMYLVACVGEEGGTREEEAEGEIEMETRRERRR